MSISAPERINNTAEDIILARYGEVAAQLDVSSDELFAAFAPSRLEDTTATLEVNGVTYSSWRHQVGALKPTDRSRGGCELSPDVTDLKILDKSLTMHEKHLFGKTGNIGGKSGMQASREAIAELNANPGDRRKLFAQHAEAHNINPFTNVIATDIGTFGPDMDAVAESLEQKFGSMAGAAASGASKRFGGEPELHAPHTGEGASIILDRYLKERAKTDPRVAEAIDGGRPLRALIQGLGKAGLYTLKTLPNYIQLAGALERHGAIVAKNGVLDRQQVLDLSTATGLSEAGVHSVENAFWLPPTLTARSEFWATEDVDVIIPAFDHHQVTAEDAKAFGGMVILSVANHPLDEEAQDILAERGIDELPDAATNIGGTISSQGIWDKYMDPDWTATSYQRKWHTDMHKVATTLLTGRAKMAAERGGFVSFAEVVNMVVVQRAVNRLRAARATR